MDNKKLAIQLARAYLARGMTHFENGDINRAMADFDKATELDADYAMAYMEWESEYAKGGRMSKPATEIEESGDLLNESELIKTAELWLGEAK